jgi:hypothetical protein
MSKGKSEIIHMFEYVDEVMDDLNELKGRVDLLEKPKKMFKTSRELVESNERMNCLIGELIHRISYLEQEIGSMKTIIVSQQKSMDLVLEKILNDECDALINSIM